MIAPLSALDMACMQHLQHGAMAGGDPLTDSLYAQLEAPATEGAQPPTPYTSGMPASSTGNGAGWWLAAATLLAALASVAFMPWRA